MKARLMDLAVGMDGKQRLTLSLEGDFREQYDALHDSEVDISVKKWRRKRSRDANAYCWVLIDKLAAELNLSKTEIYRSAIRQIGGVSEIVCVRDEAVQRLRDGWERNGVGWQTETMPSKIEGCTNVILYYGSSTFDSKQMSALIDQLVQECKQLNIETMTPNEIAALEEAWQ